MVDRFNIRDKCLAWPNVRDQQAVLESNGVNHDYSDGPVAMSIGAAHEGRVSDDDYRRANENRPGIEINKSDTEQGWDSICRRNSEFSRMYYDSVDVEPNSPFRDYLYEDWELIKNEAISSG